MDPNTKGPSGLQHGMPCALLRRQSLEMAKLQVREKKDVYSLTTAQNVIHIWSHVVMGLMEVGLCLIHFGEGSEAEQRAASSSGRNREICRNVSCPWVVAERGGVKPRCLGGWWVDMVS